MRSAFKLCFRNSIWPVKTKRKQCYVIYWRFLVWKQEAEEFLWRLTQFLRVLGQSTNWFPKPKNYQNSGLYHDFMLTWRKNYEVSELKLHSEIFYNFLSIIWILLRHPYHMITQPLCNINKDWRNHYFLLKLASSKDGRLCLLHVTYCSWADIHPHRLSFLLTLKSPNRIAFCIQQWFW